MVVIAYVDVEATMRSLQSACRLPRPQSGHNDAVPRALAGYAVMVSAHLGQARGSAFLWALYGF
jgi:hypothetical protein